MTLAMKRDEMSEEPDTAPKKAATKTVSRKVWKKRMEARIQELDARTPGLSKFVKALEAADN